MHVILYIGHHKVGSTALQIFLSRNWLRLARAGILYPSVESRGFAQNLAAALGDDDSETGPEMNIREPHSALAYRMMSEISERKVPQQFRALPAAGQMFVALRSQIRALRPRAVILCSEAFANFGMVDPALIGRLAGLFPKAEFQIYCALRRPDEYLIAWHGQRLKVGERLKALRAGGAAQYYPTIHFDFRAVIEPWTREIPGARLNIRNYADILAAGGSTEDFLARTGLDIPDGLIPAGRANTGLPRAAIEIMRRANHDLPAEPARTLCDYLLKNGARLSPAPNADIEMFGPPLRAELAERFAPIQDYLSAQAGQPAFFPDIGEIARTRPIPEAEAVAGLLARIDPAALPDDMLRGYIARLRDEKAA